MNTEFAFATDTTVKVPKLGISGVVIGNYIGRTGRKLVDIEYTANGKVESGYFDESRVVAVHD
jgi:hypothetical protein